MKNENWSCPQHAACDCQETTLEAEMDRLKNVVAQETNRYSALVRHAEEIKSTNVDLKSEVEKLKGELRKAIRRGDWLAELIVDLSGEVILRFPYEETGDPPAR